MGTNPKKKVIIKSSLEVIDNVCKSTSYNIESETTLDHDDDEEFIDFEDKPNFSLDFMKKVIDYYDTRDANGKRKHTLGWYKTRKNEDY